MLKIFTFIFIAFYSAVINAAEFTDVAKVIHVETNYVYPYSKECVIDPKCNNAPPIPNGYKVIYEYNGRMFMTILPKVPSKNTIKIKSQVSVDPDDY